MLDLPVRARCAAGHSRWVFVSDQDVCISHQASVSGG